MGRNPFLILLLFQTMILSLIRKKNKAKSKAKMQKSQVMKIYVPVEKPKLKRIYIPLVKKIYEKAEKKQQIIMKEFKWKLWILNLARMFYCVRHESLQREDYS